MEAKNEGIKKMDIRGGGSGGGGGMGTNAIGVVSDDNQQKIDYMYKVIVIGDSAVGKTQILSRFAKNEFYFDSKSTIGVEFQTRTITINDKVILGFKFIILYVARIGVHTDSYRGVTSAYCRGALGTMLVYDITKRQSFDNVATWVHELLTHADKSIVIMLIGNKADLSDRREVPTEDATSALKGDNVESAFIKLLEEIYGVVSKKALSNYNGNDKDNRNTMDGPEGGAMLNGSKIDVILGADMEISELKQLSSCSSSC
ncbi:hypothetical protein MKX01_009612 [Papaver californicum]|nr:hypothetical protein MKX01_009612 [Papaver californicum]